MTNKEQLHQDIIHYIKDVYGSNDIKFDLLELMDPDSLNKFIDDDLDNCFDMEYGINIDAFNIVSDDVRRTFEDDDDFDIDEVEDLIIDNFKITTDLYDATVEIAVIINHGDLNYDYSLHDVLNQDGKHLEDTGIYWLAKQQGKATLLAQALKDRQTKTSDTFVDSCVEELTNNTYHSNSALTVCTKIKWGDLIKLKTEIEAFRKSENIYLPTKCEDARFRDNKLTVSKDCTVGLFDYMCGGGSTMDIVVDKEIEIPVQFIHKMMPFRGKANTGYTPDDVYGFTDVLRNSNSKINF